MGLSKLAKEYEQAPSDTNKKLLEREAGRLKSEHLCAMMPDPKSAFEFAVFGAAAKGGGRSIVDYRTRRMAREALLRAYHESKSSAVREIISKGLDISDTVSELSRKMKEGEPLGFKELGDIYTHSPNAETRIEAGMKIGIPYTTIWHTTRGRLKKLIYKKNLLGNALTSAVLNETQTLQKILYAARRKYPAEHPDQVREALEKIHDDPETMKDDRIFLGGILEIPYAATLSRELDSCNLSKAELRIVYKSRDVPSSARKKAGQKLGYSGTRIWAHENPVKTILLAPFLPVIGLLEIVSAIGNALSINTGEPDDGCETYYGGAGWGWIDEDGKCHKGDNR